MSEKMTINQLLVLIKQVRSRMGELNSLRNDNSKRSSWLGLDSKETKVEEPQYDPKMVDRKISELNLFLFKADAAIKQANAFTTVDIVADVDKLLEPIQ